MQQQHHASPPRPLHVVVTGGSSGIGAAIVEAFAAAGHHVMYSYFSRPPSNDERRADNVTARFLDQGDPASVARFAAAVRRWLPAGAKLDVLVNNAALGSATVHGYLDRTFGGVRSATDPLQQQGEAAGPEADLSLSNHVLEDLALMQVNALGPLWVTQALLPLLLVSPTRRAAVIFLGSVGGGTGVFPEYKPADLMSKAAVGYLARHMAAQHAHSPVDVVCVAPGATRTSMFEQSTLAALDGDARKRFLAAMPKGSLIEPAEVAACVLAIATQGWARILHGACIDASLGLGVRPGLQTEYPPPASADATAPTPVVETEEAWTAESPPSSSRPSSSRHHRASPPPRSSPTSSPLWMHYHRARL
ncbi:hypothetical protein H9P43_004985 [Blastocladiella emersonii ATCC 22665]|nr:hypothetical protein H9P43_004985 [Blastocladiella emersonii ATCC 22665]